MWNDIPALRPRSTPDNIWSRRPTVTIQIDRVNSQHWQKSNCKSVFSNRKAAHKLLNVLCFWVVAKKIQKIRKVQMLWRHNLRHHLVNSYSSTLFDIICGKKSPKMPDRWSQNVNVTREFISHRITTYLHCAQSLFNKMFRNKMSCHKHKSRSTGAHYRTISR